VLLQGRPSPGQEVEAAAATKPAFPSDDVAQTAAVMAVLARSEISLDPESVATSFRQGRRNLTKVQAVVAALARMGFVSTADGGKTFDLRKGGRRFTSASAAPLYIEPEWHRGIQCI
jgi:hypothetical protein